MLRIIRFLLGYITFTAEGKFPERLINLTGTRGISLFNVKKYKEDGFICSSIATEYSTLLTLAKKSLVEIKIIKKTGVPFILKKYRKRYGIIFGGVLFVLIQFVLSFFVWSINVNGSKNIEPEEILNLANNFGIKIGTLKSCIDPNALETHILNELPDVSWASVNLVGSKVNLEIKEKTMPPNVSDNGASLNSPCNIVADDDAQVIRLEVYKGTPEVKVKDAVTKGQILVNGIVEDAFGKSTVCQAEAKIFAKVKKIIEEEIHLKNLEETETNKKVKRKSLMFFNLNLPLSFVPIPKGNYKKETEIKSLTVFGSKLPVTLYKETWRKYNTKEGWIPVEKAKEIATMNINRREKLEMKDTNILNYEDIFKNQNGKVCLTRTYSCIKDIAQKKPIVVGN